MNNDIKTWLRASRRLAALLGKHKDTLRASPVGRYETATVYRVRRTKVKAHWRRAHVAVRLKEVAA